MDIPDSLFERAAEWTAMKRWERRELAQDLRRLGLSYREISAVIPVPKGTLSAWCRDVELDEMQLLRVRALRPSLEARIQLGRRRRAEAVSRHEETRARGREQGKILLDDPLWTAGVAAYWAEGAKKGDVRFANSDADLILLFMKWAKRFLDADLADFSAKLNIHGGQDEVVLTRYWSGITKIPAERFSRAYVKPEGSGHRKNVLYRGTIIVRLRRSGDTLHMILGWMDSLASASRHDALSFRAVGAASSTG